MAPHPAAPPLPRRPPPAPSPRLGRAGKPKILPHCTLPLTGMRVVDTIITEKGVFSVLPDGNGLELREIANGETVESLKAATGAPFSVTDDLKPMRQ